MERKPLFGCLVSVFFVALLVTSAHADIRFTGFDSLSLEPCQSTPYGFYVTNTGARNITIILNVSGSGADFVDLSFTSFPLSAGKSVVITEQLTLPCDVAAGDYDLVIRAQGSDGSSGDFEQQLDVIRRPLVAFAVSDVNLLGCSSSEQGISVTNTRAQEQTVRAALNLSDSFDGSGAIRPRALTLASNETKNFTLTVTSEDCLQVGAFPSSFLVLAGSETAEGLFTIEVAADRVPVLAENETYSVRSDRNLTIEVPFTNEGELPANFSFTSEEEWVSPLVPVVAFDPGEEKGIEFSVFPVNTSGERNVTIVVSNGESEREFILTLEIRPAPVPLSAGAKAALVTGILLAIIIAGLILLVATPRGRSLLRRLGAFLRRRNEAFNRWRARRAVAKARRKELAAKRKAEEAEKAKKAKAEEKQRKIEERRKAKQERQIVRAEQAPQRTTSAAIASKDVNTQRTHRKEAWLLFAILVILGLLTAGILSETVNTVLIYVGGISAAILGLALVIIVLVRLLGSWKRFYIGQHSPSDTLALRTRWSTGVGELILKSEDPIFNAQLWLRSQQRSPAFLTAGPLVYSYVAVSQKNLPAKISGIARFRIPRKWLAENGQDIETIQLAVYKQNRWIHANAECVSQDSTSYYFEAPISMLSHYAIVGKKKTVPVARAPWPLKFLLQVCIIFLVASIIVASSDVGRTSLPYRAQVPGTIGPIVIEEGSFAEINLSQYFRDPDNEALTFTYEPEENIIVTIDGEIARVSAEEDFAGNRTTIFYARDLDGALTSSNDVLVEVIPRPDYSREEEAARYIRENISVITAVLAAVIVGLLGWILAYRR